VEGSQRPGGRAPALVVIGNFDGVHRGHQAVLSAASAEARAAGLSPVVLTFDPHPAAVLGHVPPPLLTTVPRKIELVARVAPEVRVDVRRFDLAFAAQTPGEFARGVLVGELGARVVVVGQNFRFGHGRAGDFAALARLGAALGFETRSHELVGDEAGAWSSTRIRAAVARGELDAASAMLGRPHMLSGVVAHGDRRGRTIGFPTCNLPDVAEELPPFGVYAVLVDRVEPGAGPGGETATSLARGVANVGVRPTVASGEARPSIEVHLFDRDDDLYGAHLRVHLVAFLRAEQRFGGLDELRAQIVRDADQARRALEGLAPEPNARGAWA
jgi:riboflavin kinase/FMN adenylyltransferase